MSNNIKFTKTQSITVIKLIAEVSKYVKKRYHGTGRFTMDIDRINGSDKKESKITIKIFRTYEGSEREVEVIKLILGNRGGLSYFTKYGKKAKYTTILNAHMDQDEAYM